MDSKQQRFALPCLVVAALVSITTLFFNGVLDAAQSPVADEARDWATLVQAAAMVVLAFVARKAPRAVKAPAASMGSIGFIVVGTLMAGLGVAYNEPALLLPGSCLVALSVAWTTVLFVVLCSGLDLRAMMLSLGIGEVLATPLALLFSRLGYVACLVLYLVFTVAGILVCLKFTGGTFEGFAQAEPASSAEVTSPRSVLPLTHDLFVYVFLFSVSYGFALRYEHTDGGILANGLIMAVFVGIALYAYLARGVPRTDVIFDIAFVLVIAGYLLVLLNDPGLVGPAGMVLTTSSQVFVLLMELALAAIAARSRPNALPAVAWGLAAYFLGIEAGAQLGMFVTALPAEQALAARGIVATVFAAILVYTLFSIRDFGFDRTIATMEAPPQPPVVEVRYTDAVDARCRELSERFALTERESEVFGLLARGNNAAHIQEELSISKNTLKYHVRHIYEKAGIHSQQELIDLLGLKG